MRERLLRRYARWLTKHPLWVVGLALFISGLSIFISFRYLKTQTGILDLYSAEEPVARRFIHYTENFGAAETLIVVFEGQDENMRRQAVTTLAQKLAPLRGSLIGQIFYKIDFSALRKHAFQFLNETQVQRMLQEFQDQGAMAMFLGAENFNDYLAFLNRSLEKGLQGSQVPQAEDISQFHKILEPISLLAEFLQGQKFTADSMLLRFDQSSKKRSLDDEGFLRTEDKKMHILTLRPVDRRQDYEAAKELVSQVREKVQELRKEFPQLEIGVTGGPALNSDQFEISKRDMTRASIFAYISTGLIFILAFKSWRRPLLGLLTLSLSLTWAFSLTTLTIGHLNMFSMAFIIILVGQGTYYGVHVVSRYEEELHRGRSVPQAIEETMAHVFGNITTSTVTTSAAFFATMLVPLKGFAELGWIAGFGILLSSFGMQFVLPAFLLLFDRKRMNRDEAPDSTQIPLVFENNVAVSPRSQRFLNFYQHWSWIFVILLVGIALLGAFFGLSPHYGIPFDSNILNLQAKGTEAVQYEKKLMDTSLSPRAGIFIADSYEAGKKIVTQLRSLPTIQRVEWLGDVFPDNPASSEVYQTLRQKITAQASPTLTSPNLAQFGQELHQLQQNLEKIGSLALNAPSGEKIIENSETALSAIEKILRLYPQNSEESAPNAADESQFSANLSEFQKIFFSSLRTMFREAAQSSPMTLEEVPVEILTQFHAPKGLFAIYAFPSVNIWERKDLELFVHDLKSIDPEVTGPPIMFDEILSRVQKSYFLAAGLAALAILIIFSLDFRSWRYTLLAFTPLVLGICCLLVMMRIFGISFNTANLIALPMILGIGADNGVHLIHRFREEGEKNIDFLFKSTGRAVLITYLDTVTSFLLLAFASHQGLQQLGKVVIVGYTCCTIAAFIFIPTILRRWIVRS